MPIRKLKFVNSDATPKVVVLFVREGGIASIMQWYGGFHAGDRYYVSVDDIKVEKDQGGELVGNLPQVDVQPLGSQVQPESSVAVCAICDIAGCEHLRGEVTGCTMFTAMGEQK